MQSFGTLDDLYTVLGKTYFETLVLRAEREKMLGVIKDLQGRVESDSSVETEAPVED